jgi:hypothetical protein
MSPTADWTMLLGVLSAVGTASVLIYAWVLNDAEHAPEPARVREDDEELRAAA